MLEWSKIKGSTMCSIHLRHNGCIAQVWTYKEGFLWSVYGTQPVGISLAYAKECYIAGGGDSTQDECCERALKIMEEYVHTPA